LDASLFIVEEAGNPWARRREILDFIEIEERIHRAKN